MTDERCQGYPQIGCGKPATHHLLGWALCAECGARAGSAPEEPDDTIQHLREQIALDHDAMGAARALLHELDASGSYPHQSIAIGVVLMALERALQ